MSKIGRNQPCPCGSGKKFKKCCIDKPIQHSNINSNRKNSFEEFVKNNKSTSLLKFFSLLQVLPENHGKIVRLEDIQTTIASNLNNAQSNIDLSILKKLVDKNFPDDYREDPLENCFTENIMFHNGNNVVFTGINHNATEIIQNLIRVIFHTPNNLNEDLKNYVSDGLLFMLLIHNEIAKNLGFSRNMSGSSLENNITFPSDDLLKYTQLFEFPEKMIFELFKKLGINKDVINDFLCDVNLIKENQNSEIPLLCYKPFIKVNKTYFLVLPSSELFAINNFIVEKFKQFGELDNLIGFFDKFSIFEIKKLFIGIGWEQNQEFSLDVEQSLWKFDENKYAFIQYLGTNDFNNSLKLQKKVNDKVQEIKNVLPPHAEILMLFVYSQISMIEMLAINTFDVKAAKYQSALSLIDFERIIQNYNIDKLSLWKLFKAKERAREKGLYLFATPVHNIMTDFEWYNKQGETFLHPDEKYDFVNFSFDVQGNAAIKSIQKKDIHLVNYINEDKTKGFLPVIKSEIYAPIYLSEEIFFGKYRLVLEKYNFPLWITFENKYRKIGSSYAEAIAYWFNRIHYLLNPLTKNFHEPIEVILSFEDNFINLSIEEFRKLEKNTVLIDYQIDSDTNRINLRIPNTFFNLTNRDDNSSEIYLIRILLESLGKLFEKKTEVNISAENIHAILENIPNDNTKMLLSATSELKIDLDERHIPKVRYIPKADGSIVLEELKNWVPNKIPENIDNKSDKVKLCDVIISSLIKKIREELQNYNCFAVLEYLMLRYESTLNFRAFRSIKVVTQLKCFGEYRDILEEYHNSDVQAVRLSLSSRCLIEFVTAEPYFGEKPINEDDLDFLLALMDELNYFGTIRDLIFFDLDNPKVGLLASGRIGVSKEFFDDTMSKFNLETRKDELGHYVKSFKTNYITTKQRERSNTIENDNEDYYQLLDSAFLNDWGMTLPNIVGVLNLIAHYCLESKRSCMFMKEDDFISLLKNEINISEEEVKSIYTLLVLNSRGKFDEKVDGYEYAEIIPWRYNRRLSYLLKPILRINDKVNNNFIICFSARHLYIAGQNLLAIFFDGTLRVDDDCKQIREFVKRNSTEKGDEFTVEVRDWIRDNTNLFVLDYEFDITTKIADKNYGDVDVLALDEKRKILYSIECKNTKQAKIIYDFWKDIKNFTEKQLPKHINREKWLSNNLSVVSQRINKDVSGFKVKSIIVSSSVLPVKFVEVYKDITFTTLSQLVLENIF